jgi:hypothetical protein
MSVNFFFYCFYFFLCFPWPIYGSFSDQQTSGTQFSSSYCLSVGLNPDAIDVLAAINEITTRYALIAFLVECL